MRTGVFLSGASRAQRQVWAVLFEQCLHLSEWVSETFAYRSPRKKPVSALHVSTSLRSVNIPKDKNLGSTETLHLWCASYWMQIIVYKLVACEQSLTSYYWILTFLVLSSKIFYLPHRFHPCALFLHLSWLHYLLPFHHICISAKKKDFQICFIHWWPVYQEINPCIMLSLLLTNDSLPIFAFSKIQLVA